VVLFPGRVGSTFLVSALDAHPEVEAKGERLDPLRADGPAAQLDWTRRYLRGPIVNRHRAVGFKTKLRDVLDQDAFAALLDDLGARIIVSDRRNDVKHVVSRITARRLKDTTGRWNRYAGDEAGTTSAPPVVVDLDDFDERLRAVVREKASILEYVERLGLLRLHVDYEDLLAAPDATFGEVLDFLGVRTAPMTGATVKHTSDDLRDVIENFDELRARYAGTPYEAMFDEVLV
jgi:LPS sulfotransferase NodH